MGNLPILNGQMGPDGKMVSTFGSPNDCQRMFSEEGNPGETMRSPGKAGCANPSDGEPEYPGVPSIIEAMDDARCELLLQARSQALSLPEVSETALYDGFFRHWTPAYYVGETQLFHVHNFREGLRATIFLGGKKGSEKLGPMILGSDRIPEELRLQVVKAAESRGTKQIKVKLNSMDDVAVLLELARLKHQSIK